jgi:hypothetical protein
MAKGGGEHPASLRAQTEVGLGFLERLGKGGGEHPASLRAQTEVGLGFLGR